jgi:peptidyl-Lys metalloendopeptidase
MDYVYGQDDSKSLAGNDPDTAAMNADSHEYFAENPSALV